MLFVKTAPSPNDDRSMPQFYDWLDRLAGVQSRPPVETFLVGEAPKGKLKPDVATLATLNLWDRLEETNSDTVVAMGAPVVKALLGNVNMAYVHGIPHETVIAGREITVFPMFDPAAGFASKGLLAVLAHDMKALGAFLRGELAPWAPDPRPAVAKWLLEPPSRLPVAPGAVVGLDTEGWADRPVTVQFCCDGETGWVIDPKNGPVMEWFHHWVSDKTVSMHNGIGDLPVLRAMGVHIDRFHDTQLMAFHEMLVTGSGALESEAQNLGTLCYRHCRLLLGELADIPGVDLGNRLISPSVPEFLFYAGMDAVAQFRLTERLLAWLDENPETKRCYEIDQAPALFFREMMDAGMPIDYDAATEYYVEALEKETMAREALEGMAERRGVHEFNPRSANQVRELVTRKYGLKIRKRTKGGAASTNEKALAIHADHPFVQSLQGHRELTKLLGTYLLPLMTELAEQ